MKTLTKLTVAAALAIAAAAPAFAKDSRSMHRATDAYASSQTVQPIYDNGPNVSDY